MSQRNPRRYIFDNPIAPLLIPQGVLYPLQCGVLFLKPALFIPAAAVASIAAGRGGAAQTRYIDIQVRLLYYVESVFYVICRLILKQGNRLSLVTWKEMSCLHYRYTDWLIPLSMMPINKLFDCNFRRMFNIT